MFGKGFKIFTLFGFEVRADASWSIIAALITWSLARGFFPRYYPGLPQNLYWWMGIAGAAGLFLSIVFHEFFHSLVARRFGLAMKGITLFIFGGVAELTEEPENARTEFLMAAAGPASSIVLAAIFSILSALSTTFGVAPTIAAVISYLGVINWSLAAFNLFPAFPLDGGRMLRSGLWTWKKDLNWATRKASAIGSGFGYFLVFLGTANVLIGNFMGGLWFFLIGLFMKNAARASYEQIVMRNALEGTKVRSIMKKDAITVPPDLSVREFVDDYVYKFHFKMFPVVREGRLEGCVSARDANIFPRDEWPRRTVADIISQCSRENTIGPDYDALKALKLMNTTGESRLMVVDEGALAGIISNKDLLQFISTKMELEGKTGS